MYQQHHTVRYLRYTLSPNHALYSRALLYSPLATTTPCLRQELAPHTSSTLESTLHAIRSQATPHPYNVIEAPLQIMYKIKLAKYTYNIIAKISGSGTLSRGSLIVHAVLDRGCTRTSVHTHTHTQAPTHSLHSPACPDQQHRSTCVGIQCSLHEDDDDVMHASWWLHVQPPAISRHLHT